MADKAAVLREVQKALSKGQYNRAIELWEGYVRENPDGTVYNTIGDLYFRSGNRDRAIEYYHRAADFFDKEGFLTKAQALYKKILNVNPQDGKALFKTGNICESKGLVTDAIKYYLSAIDAFIKNNDQEGLQNATERITKLSPDNIPLRVKLAEYFQKEGFTENTAKEYISIGQICEQKGEIDKAKQFYEKAIEIYPRLESIYTVVIDFYKSLQLYDDAVALLDKGIELYPERVEYKMKKAEFLIMKGTPQEAKNILNELLSRSTDKELQTQITRLLIDAHLAEGNTELAWEKLKPILLELFNLEGKEKALQVVERFREGFSREVSERLIEIFKSLEDSDGLFHEYIQLGDLLRKEGNNEDALRYYKEAQRINPDDEELNQRIYQLELTLKPVQEVEKAQKKEEKSADEKLVDADIFVRYGLFEEALDVLEKLKVQEPENIEVHKRLKNIYLELNDKEQAVTECLILSKIYEKYGEYENKEQALKEAFDINPEDPRLIELTHKTDESAHISTSSETEFVGTTLPDIDETEITQETVQPGQVSPFESFEETEKIELPAESGTIESTAEFQAPPVDDLTELIAEADFYFRQELYNDALNVYERLLSIHPDNQEFKERVEEIKRRLGQVQEPESPVEEQAFKTEPEPSGLKEEPLATSETELSFTETPPEELPPTTETEEEELITEELTTPEEDFTPPEPELTNEVMEIFEEFKKGIADELEEEDYETHYNLGIAYKEMGLLDDAIKEFQVAKNDPERRVNVMSMLGVCYMEKQLYSLAIDAYKEALKHMDKKDESYWGTRFDLATAYEKNGDLKTALDIFVEIYGWDSKFRDVDKKVNNLKKMLSEDRGEAEVAEEEPQKRKDRISYI